MKRETLLNYAKKQFHAEPNYLWNIFPRYAVLRHHDDGDKWFAIVMNVPGTKLGFNDDKEVDILNVKLRPEYIGSLRKKKVFCPLII
nr:MULTISPECIES: hypothetical protein [unclassified Gilliamella]